MCFPCDQLLQYQRVTSKLGATSENVVKGLHLESELYKVILYVFYQMSLIDPFIRSRYWSNIL